MSTKVTSQPINHAWFTVQERYMSDTGKGKNEMDRLDNESGFHAEDIAHFIPFYRRTTGSSFQLISRLFCAALAAVISCYCSCYSGLLLCPCFHFTSRSYFAPRHLWLCDCVFHMNEWSLEGWQIGAACSGGTRCVGQQDEGIQLSKGEAEYFYKPWFIFFIIASAHWSSEYFRN